MVNRQVRVRFAPSPTGPLHIGGVRSALFNWLIAKKLGGKFVLRIEDTDLERSSRQSEENIKDSLRWMGLPWDEGVDVGGPGAPYRQTERLDTYKEYTQKLLDSGKAYYCYCTDEELEQERKTLSENHQMPRYLGKCANLTKEQIKEFESQGKKPTVRFRVPKDEQIVVNDLIRGKVTFDSNGIGDFVIVKSDGIPTYNYAVVIDDVLMQITHVIRGEEHLSNTPRQLLVYRALGFQKPEFGHVSLILGKDRSKMSKRHGSTAVEQYRKKGYLPAGLLNFLVLLGWSTSDEQEFFSLEELVEKFSLESCAKNPAIFDVDKLNWINAHHLRQLDDEQLYALALPHLIASGFFVEHTYERSWLVSVVATAREHVSYGEQIPEQIKVYFTDEFELDAAGQEILKEDSAKVVLKIFKDKIGQVEQLTVDCVKAILKAVGKESGFNGKKVFMPIRIALTGQMHGAELTQIIPLLGKERIAMRIDSSLSKI